MTKLNGTQLYGLKKLMMTLRIGLNKELKALSLKQKLSLNYVTKESKMTQIGDKLYTNTFTPYFPSLAYDRFLKGVIATVSGNPFPIITNFAVTPQCPCNCWHCSFADRSKKDILSLAQLKTSISEVQDLGSSVVGITGGEPLLRKDLEDIIACIDKRSMPILFTTGYELTTQRVRRLKEAGLEIPVISLDHYLPEVHDKGRGREGMYEYALTAIRLFQEQGFYVAVSFVPDRKLVDDREAIFKTIDFFRDLGINDMRLTSPILSGHLTARPETLLTKENVKTIWEIQKKCTNTPGYPGVFAYDFFESDQYYGCGAGFNYMFVDSQGCVCPCDFTMLTFGNIMETSIKKIWEKMNQEFCIPGCTCYANKSSDIIASKKLTQWPLSEKVSKEVVKACPPYDRRQIPEFYQRMGLKAEDR